jgi:hypothetical protein
VSSFAVCGQERKLDEKGWCKACHIKWTHLITEEKKITQINNLRNLRKRGHWGDPDVDGRIILRWIFKKLEVVVGTGQSWLRIGTGGGHI